MMFFWSEIPRWIYAVIAAAIAAIIGIVLYVVRSQVSVSAGAVQYTDEYNKQGVQTRESRRAAPSGGFAPREGAPEYNTRLPDRKTQQPVNTPFIPSQSGGRGDRGTNAPIVNAPQQGRGGERN